MILDGVELGVDGIGDSNSMESHQLQSIRNWIWSSLPTIITSMLWLSMDETGKYEQNDGFLVFVDWRNVCAATFQFCQWQTKLIFNSCEFSCFTCSITKVLLLAGWAGSCWTCDGHITGAVQTITNVPKRFLKRKMMILDQANSVPNRVNVLKKVFVCVGSSRFPSHSCPLSFQIKSVKLKKIYIRLFYVHLVNVQDAHETLIWNFCSGISSDWNANNISVHHIVQRIQKPYISKAAIQIELNRVQINRICEKYYWKEFMW